MTPPKPRWTPGYLRMARMRLRDAEDRLRAAEQAWERAREIRSYWDRRVRDAEPRMESSDA